MTGCCRRAPTATMGSALQSRRTVGVIAGGQQVYVTDTSTYVSTTDWTRDGLPPKTSLHKFTTAQSGGRSYKGSSNRSPSTFSTFAGWTHRTRPPRDDRRLRQRQPLSGRWRYRLYALGPGSSGPQPRDSSSGRQAAALAT